MSTAVMSSSMMFDYGDYFKTGTGSAKVTKDAVAAAAMSQQMLGALAAGQQQQQQSPVAVGAGNSGPGNASMRRSYSNLVNLLEQHRKLDRTVSEPTTRYKTELCRPFEESGSCKYGDKCQFAHGYNELRNLARHPKYKTELCRTFHKIGFCPYGPRCHFVHNFEEARIHNLKLAAAAVAGVNSAPLGLGPLLPQQQQQQQQQPLGVGSLARANSLNLPLGPLQHHQQQHQLLHRAPLHRSSSLGLPESHAEKPAPLNLSPTFSLGSAADSISPSSSLSQSPTNSMTSFFNDEPANGLAAGVAATAAATSSFAGFGQELAGLLRHSPSPPALGSRTQSPLSPLSPGAESRLPIFNQISSTIFDSFDNLKI